MRAQCVGLATFAIAILAAVARPSEPPTTGWLWTYDGVGHFVFPFSATQCEPYYIWYNASSGIHWNFYDASTTTPHYRILFSIDVPVGIGYLEWICNIPAGIAFFFGFPLTNIVQPGTSSACLGDITTAYSFLEYPATVFASYTRTASTSTSLPTNTLNYNTTSFPTGIFGTITVNPNLAVTPTSPSSSPTLTSSPPSSPTLTSSPSPSPAASSSTTPPPKSQSSLIAAGVVSGVAFFLLIALIFVFWRRRRSSALAGAPSSIDPQPGRWATDEPGLISPFLVSGNEPTSDSSATVVPVTNNPAIPLLGQRSPPARASKRLGADPILPSQQLHEPPDSGRLASHSKSAPSLASPASSTAGQQPSFSRSSNTSDNAAPETLQGAYQQPSTSETQEGAPDILTILGVISRLSPRDRQVIASVNNLLTQIPPASPDIAGEDTTLSPPPYMG